jgi:hypothetical protein
MVELVQDCGPRTKYTMADRVTVAQSCVLCLCSLDLWLELNLKLNPTAMNLPSVICISDNIRVPDGGFKSKAM